MNRADLLLRLLIYLFVLFGLFLALPVIAWNVASRHLPVPAAALVTGLCVFIPVGIALWRGIEGDPDDEEVPLRIDTARMSRVLIQVGASIGAVALALQFVGV